MKAVISFMSDTALDQWMLCTCTSSTALFIILICGLDEITIHYLGEFGLKNGAREMCMRQNDFHNKSESK